jgi:hypothetical protein
VPLLNNIFSRIKFNGGLKKTDKIMENSLDHLFGNLMGGVEEIVKEAEALVEKLKENEQIKIDKGTEKDS